MGVKTLTGPLDRVLPVVDDATVALAEPLHRCSVQHGRCDSCAKLEACRFFWDRTVGGQHPPNIEVDEFTRKWREWLKE